VSAMAHLPKVRKSETDLTGDIEPKERGISRWKLALGAASLFFFVVGVKRSFRTDDGREILKSDADMLEEQRKELRREQRKDLAPKPAATKRPARR
jgi:hypothetical protein